MKSPQFFELFFKDCNDGYITLWTLPDKRTYWFRADEYKLASETALKLGKNSNTFFGLGIRKEKMENGKRGSKDDISSVVALYADIDVLGPAHKETELPKTKEEAIEFLNTLPLKPSVIVWSGNGLHSYWLLDKPYHISVPSERNYISSISEGWGKFVNGEALKRGWKIDTVSDLARVLRVPGTVNYKINNGAKCEVVSSNNDRFSVEVFDKYKLPNQAAAYEREVIDGIITGSAAKIMDKCLFIKHCKDNATTLPEPYWYAMITNLSLANDGASLIHVISKPYQGYNRKETEDKIRRAIKENKPHTCKYIKDNLSFDGCTDCAVKAPIAYAIINKEEQVRDILETQITDYTKVFDKEFIEAMSYAKDRMPEDYSKFKVSVRGKVNIRDIESCIKFNKRAKSITGHKLEILELDNINLDGMVSLLQ